MKEVKRALVVMKTILKGGGVEYTTLDGKPLTKETVELNLAMGQLVPNDDGLFPDFSQTYSLR